MRVAIGLSGGVDSAVAAAKLVAAGHDVVGVSMLVWPGSRCCGAQALQDAGAVAKHLGIPHEVYDLVGRFTALVVTPFLEAYSLGRTPNPCPVCNERLKFEQLWEVARESTGAERLATGHYARTRRNESTGLVELLRGKDRIKDQSYMLFRLSQEQLSNLLTPLGEQTKADTRAEARRLGLVPVEDKPDSQDLCFTSDDLPGFLSRHLPDQDRPGAILDRDGRQIGQHRGTIHYTVGQRRGLGVASPAPLYVLDILPHTNTLVVGPRSESFCRSLAVEDIRWTSIEPATQSFRAEVKVRHTPQGVPATVMLDVPGRPLVLFDEPQAGVAKGQYAVFYQDDLVLGGGTIAETGRV